MTSRDGAEVAWASLPSTANDVHADEGISSIHTSSHTEAASTMPTPIVTLPVDLPTMLKQIENAYINAALTQTRCNKKEAAKLLGMGRTTLVEKLRRRTAAERA
jgi:DNA-binding NtrC family response regulator